MNEDTSPAPLLNEIHSVFEFTLRTSPHGTPKQNVKNMGEYESIEEAFGNALALARREAAILVTASATAPSAEHAEPAVTILSTEWGYDVRREYHTVTRFWIHSRPRPT